MADKSLKAGDRITLTYNDLLLKYLDRALEYTMSVKVPKADVPIYSARKNCLMKKLMNLVKVI